MRENEKKALEKGGFVQSINTMSMLILPAVVAMVTLVSHTALGNNLTPAQVGVGLWVMECVCLSFCLCMFVYVLSVWGLWRVVTRHMLRRQLLRH